MQNELNPTQRGNEVKKNSKGSLKLMSLYSPKPKLHFKIQRPKLSSHLA